MADAASNVGEAEEIVRDVIVRNKLGLHLRPAAKIVKALAEFDCDITLVKDRKSANAKSIMSLTTLIAPFHSVLTIRATGSQAQAAVLALAELFENKFGEE